MKTKKVISAGLAAVLSAGLIAGCGSSDSGTSVSSTASSAASAAVSTGSEEAAADTSSSAEADGASKYPEFITVDVFDSQANYQGIQSGWFAKMVKDRFNMELNIIAPNVAGGGDTLFQTRSANGNLGDLILTNSNQGRLQDLVTAGLVMDITPYMSGETYLNNYTDAINSLNDLVTEDGIYAIPRAVSTTSPVEPGEVTEPTCALLLRWDLYQQIGAPEIDKLEDVLPILQQMKEIAGTSDSGQEVYGLSLFSDWDSTYMQNAFTLGQILGYDIQGFCQYDVTTGDTYSIIDDDSPYVRALRFLYQANQMGLVDPESTTQNYDTMASKVTDGRVLYQFWPWCGMGLYNSTEHTSEGKGYMPVPMKEGRFLCYGASNVGDSDFDIMVGSQAQDPQRMVDFINWLYSPEGIVCSGSQTASAPGPEGLTWEVGDDGKPHFTDFGKQVIIDMNQEAAVPDDWGGGTYVDGISALNYQPVGTKDVNPETNIPYNYKLWDEYQELTSTKLTDDYKAKTGYYSSLEYLESLGELAVEPGNNYAAPAYSTDMTTEQEQCKQVILDSSWQMVFASDEDTFNATLKDMQDTVKGLGYDDVYAFDEQNAKDRFALFEQIREENK